MTDTEIVDWLESQWKFRLGYDPVHRIAYDVFQGIPLREAVTKYVATQPTVAAPAEPETIDAEAD